MPNAKGTTLIGAVRFLRHHRQRALGVLRPEHHHYLDERIQPSKWYPEADLLNLIETIVELIPASREEALTLMGAQTAREHLEGVYSHLAGGRDLTPSTSQAFALWASQHDSGRLEIEKLGPNEALMTVRDFGLPSEAMCGIFAGYFTELIRLQGGESVSANKLECVLRDDPRCAWQVSSKS